MIQHVTTLPLIPPVIKQQRVSKWNLQPMELERGFVHNLFTRVLRPQCNYSPIYLFTYLPGHLFTYSSIHLVDIFTYLPISIFTYLLIKLFPFLLFPLNDVPT